MSLLGDIANVFSPSTPSVSTSSNYSSETAKRENWARLGQIYTANPTAQNQAAYQASWNAMSQDVRRSITAAHDQEVRQGEIKSAQNQANTFRKDQPDYIYGNYQPLVDSAGYNLQKSEKEIAREYNSRGLYGGAQMLGKIISTRSQVASQLSAMKGQINQDVMNIQNGMDTTVANAGLSNYQTAVNQSNQAYQTGLANAVQRRQAQDSLFAGVGAGIGTYYGAQNAPKQTMNNSYIQSPETTFSGFEDYGRQRGF